MKIGLELHQRLDTSKLFCECPYLLIEGEEPEVKITRRLHPVLSELGEVDEASKQEFAKGKAYEYYAYGKANCMVEIDEEPPHKINTEALATVLQIANQLHSKPVDEVHVMRKIIIDGSITSGFQRTAVVSLGGYLETSRGKVRITQLSLEEESAGIVETGKEKSIFELDRMGIPLIEITTEPDIKDAEHLSEVAEKIGLLMRATGKVARGLGTIRQDLNISVEGGARVEIKGAQDLKLLPTLLKEEVRRQENLIKLDNEIKRRDAEAHAGVKPLTDIFRNTNAKLIKNGIENGQGVSGVAMSGFKGLLGVEIQTGRRFGTELSDYAKTAGVKGIIHSDEDLNKYGISQEEVEKIKKELNLSSDDAFALVVAQDEVRIRALHYAVRRANMKEIPKETRRANQDGTTSYMRPLPGKARLYPETDIPPIEITGEMIKRADKGESLEEKKEKLVGLLKNKDMAERVLKSRSLGLFEKLVEEGNDPMLVANTLENTLVSLRREGFELKDLEILHGLFAEYRKGKFVKAAIPEVVKGIVKTGKNIEEVVGENQLGRIAGKELEKIARENNYDVGKIMQKYRLRVEVSDLSKIKRNP